MYEVESVIQMLQQYFEGNALLVVAFLGLLYWMKKCGNHKRYIACVAVLLAVFLNDIVFKFVIRAGESNTYYRVLWILPVTLMAGYMGIELWSNLSGWKKRGFVLILILFIFIYAVPPWESWVDWPSNIYQLDDEVIEIADMIEEHSGGERVNIIDDYSISWHIREYNDNLCDPGAEDYYLRLVMSEKCVTLTKEEIENAALMAQIDYIILQKERVEANSAFANAGFELIGSSDRYNIYYMNRPAIAAGMS